MSNSLKCLLVAVVRAKISFQVILNPTDENHCEDTPTIDILRIMAASEMHGDETTAEAVMEDYDLLESIAPLEKEKAVAVTNLLL